MLELFQKANVISEPWLIKSINFDSQKKRLDIQVDFKRGATFTDSDPRQSYKAY